MAERLTYDAARQMAHWFWVVQPSRVPETLIGRDPDLYVRNIIEQWGGSDVIEPEVIDEYVRCMRRPEVLRTMGAEYRADQLDLEHDSRSDRRSSNRLPAARSVGGGRINGAVWRSARHLAAMGRSSRRRCARRRSLHDGRIAAGAHGSDQDVPE
jgi:hypothetical protein